MDNTTMFLIYTGVAHMFISNDISCSIQKKKVKSDHDICIEWEESI
jgi:hypothetical protein